jgi:hypothetical protein
MTGLTRPSEFVFPSSLLDKISALQVKTDWVDVRNFGADDKGLTSSTTAFDQAIAYLDSMGGGELHLPFGDYVGDITVNSSNIKITGSGRLKGTIKLYGADMSGADRFAGTGNIEITGITLLGEQIRNAITMKWVFGVSIHGCWFQDCVKAINFEPVPRGQHCSRIDVNNNRFIDCNYDVYIDYVTPLAGELAYLVGDLNFNHNTCEARRSGATDFGHIYHLYLKGIDGLSADSNTLFFNPNSTARKSNIYIEIFNWVEIGSGNKLFEPAEHGVRVINGQNLKLHNFHVAWSGKQAVRITNVTVGEVNGNVFSWKDDNTVITDRTGVLIEDSPFFIGNVSNNKMYFPNEHAVKIINSSNLKISDNVARNKYSTVEPIKIDFATCANIDVDDNLLTGYSLSINKVVAQKPASSTVNFSNNYDGVTPPVIQGVVSPPFKSYTNNSATVDISNATLLVLANSVATTITSLTSEDLNVTYQREVLVYSYNGNTSISRTIPNVEISGTTASVNIPAKGTMRLLVYGGTVKEVSRNFPVT